MSTTVQDPNKGNKGTIVIVVVAIVAIIAVIAGIFLLRQQADAKGVWDMNAKVPESLSVEYIEDEGLGHYISFQTVDNPTDSMDVFEDPSCPFCREFGLEYGSKIFDNVDDGKLEYNVHLMNFLDDNSGFTYSDDASAVAIELARAGDADNAWRVTSGFWDSQPATGASTDSIPTMTDMIDTLRESENVSDEVIAALEEEPLLEGQRIMTSNVTNIDSLTATTGRVSVPTVFYNEEELSFENPKELHELMK